MFALTPRRAITLLTAAAISLAAAPAPQQLPDLDALLRSAARYVAQYEEAFSAVVSEESYTQYLRRSGGIISATRQTKSDVLVINGGVYGWMGFRDVFQVDGKAIRDHEDRLLKLVTQPASDSLEQAKRMADESARFNLGAIVRTINMPTLALTFLRKDMQDRSTFTVAGTKKIDGHQTVELRFAEQAMPRIIASSDAAPATGRFWLDPVTGRIIRTELVVDSADTRASITVTYAERPKISVWVPASMDESYMWPSKLNGGNVNIGSGSIECHASYNNFRSFNVDVKTIVK
jgi:hypothetical protein